MYEVTVFTPVYNRGYTLTRLYQSLIEQTYKDFEWIIVNDGSTDNTDEVIRKFIKEDKLKIKYKEVTNAGKHCAINDGVKLAEGRLFFIVDSDDYLPQNSLERNIYWESTIENKHEFAGVAGCRGNEKGQIIGGSFKGVYIDATVLERKGYNITGDKAEVFYLDILKKFPFPKFDGENFISESAVWLQIAQAGYSLRWFNEISYFGEYLTDGLTAKGNDLFLNNPQGFLYTVNLERECYKRSKLKVMKLNYAYYMTMKRKKVSVKQCAEDLGVSSIYLKLLDIIYCLKKKISK